MRSARTAKKGLDKISAEQLRCLARLQRHARAQAWPAGGPPWPFGLGAAILHGFTVTERRQRNGLKLAGTCGRVAIRGSQAVVSDRSEGSRRRSVTRLARQQI